MMLFSDKMLCFQITQDTVSVALGPLRWLNGVKVLAAQAYKPSSIPQPVKMVPLLAKRQHSTTVQSKS